VAVGEGVAVVPPEQLIVTIAMITVTSEALKVNFPM